jgi:hypothetical protein
VATWAAFKFLPTRLHHMLAVVVRQCPVEPHDLDGGQSLTESRQGWIRANLDRLQIFADHLDDLVGNPVHRFEGRAGYD